MYFSYAKSVDIQIVSAHVCYIFLWLTKCVNVTVAFIHGNHYMHCLNVDAYNII